VKRIPADIDQLMWTLAEEGSESALRQFQIRYPEYSAELESRRSAIGGLRGARPGHVEAPPKFRRSEPKPEPVDRRFQTLTMGLGIAAVAAASFTIAYFATPRSAPGPLKSEATPQPVATAFEGTPKLDRPVFVDAPVNSTPDPVAVDDTPSYLKPQQVSIRRARLSTALQTIAVQGGLELVIGPGLVDPEVVIDYDGMNTIEILQDLGGKYAFTAFDQGDGSVIIVPVIESPESGSAPFAVDSAEAP